MKTADKKRFIAGATCPKCGLVDKICWIIAEENERIECVNCGYVEFKPQIVKKTSNQEQTIHWVKSKK